MILTIDRKTFDNISQQNKNKYDKTDRLETQTQAKPAKQHWEKEY